jgi:hypothetical protein
MNRKLPVLASMLLMALAIAAAAEPVNVVLGVTDCFVIRVPDGDTSPSERAARIRGVYESNRAELPGRFTIRAEGPRRLIYLDGDYLIAVTPADALATHHESAATLAPVWRDRLRFAWDERRGGNSASASTTAASASSDGTQTAILLIGLVLLTLMAALAALLRQSRQMSTLIQESADWRREVSESIAQPRALAALPAAGTEVLPETLQGEVIRMAREESQAAVNEAVQRICDSVERVMAGLLEEMARGMTRPAGAETGGAGVSLGNPLAAREPALAGGARSPATGGSNGGAESVAHSVESSDAPAPDATLRAADGATRRGPVTLEIAAYGKTYAFPMASDRGRDVVAAWEAGSAVPESWLHESGITTARLQPLLERFVLRRHLEADGTLSYLLDTRGGAVKIALRNVA